jgi:thioredoxin 1
MKLLKFYADWCMPCRNMTKMMEGMGDKITVPVENINIDEEHNQDLVMKYSVRTIPMFVLVNEEGFEIKRNVGSMTESKLMSFITEEYSE